MMLYPLGSSILSQPIHMAQAILSHFYILFSGLPIFHVAKDLHIMTPEYAESYVRRASTERSHETVDHLSLIPMLTVSAPKKNLKRKDKRHHHAISMYGVP